MMQAAPRSGEVAAAVCAACFKHGLIIETSGSHDEVVKVLAPLTIKDAQFRAGLDTLEAAFDAALRGQRIAAE
jgi:diaminobutyrate-2-oxoglutarate transaminase